MRYRKELFISKSDVWSNGKHWMTSASRDIYDDFYISIAKTFISQFNTPEQIEYLEYINGARNWLSTRVSKIGSAAQKAKAIPSPEYKRTKVSFEISDSFEHDVIYKDFDDFFHNAPHGFYAEDTSINTVKQLYYNFISDYSIENLKIVLEREEEFSKTMSTYFEQKLASYIAGGRQGKWWRWEDEDASKLYNEKMNALMNQD